MLLLGMGLVFKGVEGQCTFKPGQPGFGGNAELALRGGSGHASATEDHFWDWRGRRGGIQTLRSRCGTPPTSLTKYEEKEYYGNAKIVLSIRSGIDRRVDAIWMR